MRLHAVNIVTSAGGVSKLCFHTSQAAEISHHNDIFGLRRGGHFVELVFVDSTSNTERYNFCR